MAETVDYADGPEREEEMCVLTEDLGPILESWLEKKWKRFHQERNATSKGDGIIGPMALLEFESNVQARQIDRIVSRELVSVDIDIADRLLLAVDRWLWEIEVYPKSEVRSAALAQRDLLALVARSHGIHVDKSKVTWPQTTRRRLHLIQGGKS